MEAVEFAGLGVADAGGEEGEEGDGGGEVVADAFGVDAESCDAEASEAVRGVGEEAEGLEEAPGDEGEVLVEFEVGEAAGRGEGVVEGVDEEAGLDDELGDDGVGLAGHDGGAFLEGGEDEFRDAAVGSGGGEAEVFGDLHEVGGGGREGA